MVMEIAQLNIKPGQEAAFQEAFAKCLPALRAFKGVNSVELRRSVETPSRFWAMVHWDSVSAHMDGFVKSPAAQELMGGLGPFFDGPTTMEHCEGVLKA